MYYELILTHNLQMSLLEELKQKMKDAEQNYKQNKQNYEDAYNQINKKTDEVERLVEENKKKNTGMQEVLAKIICAEENYVVAHMAHAEAIKACAAAAKVYNEQRYAISAAITALQKTETEDEMEENKAFYVVEKEAEQKFKEAEDCQKKGEIKWMMVFYSDEYQKQNPSWIRPTFSDALLSSTANEVNNIRDVYKKAIIVLNNTRDSREANKRKFINKRQLSYNTMWDNFNKSETRISLTIAQAKYIKAKNLMADALQKYETEKLNFFKAHLTDTLSDIEWKRSNFEMVEVMLKQISVLQACEQKRAEEKRITRAWTFGFICAVFGVGLTWFRNKDFEYPLIDVTAPVGYLGIQ